MRKTIIVIAGFALLFPILAWAKIGVGVGTGKIVMDQPLKPGMSYTLPALVVVNTGDESSDYGVALAFRQNQPELRPDQDWFRFEPSNFHLEPGKSQVIQIKLSLPVKGAAPGDYFAFLEGHPVKKIVEGGGTSLGVAAAAKLYFSVEPSNVFVAMYYRIASLYKLYAPWSYVVSAVILVALLTVLFRKYFSFNIGIGVKKR